MRVVGDQDAMFMPCHARKTSRYYVLTLSQEKDTVTIVVSNAQKGIARGMHKHPSGD